MGLGIRHRLPVISRNLICATPNTTAGCPIILRHAMWFPWPCQTPCYYLSAGHQYHIGWYVTPLHTAFPKGNIDVTTFLLEHGADVTACNCNSKTALHGASQWAHLDVMELLLKHHVDVDGSRRGRGHPDILGVIAWPTGRRTSITTAWRFCGPRRRT